MTKRQLKELEDLKVLQQLVSNYNVRLRVHLHEREALMKEHDWLEKKLLKAMEKAEKEEEGCVLDATGQNGKSATAQTKE